MQPRRQWGWLTAFTPLLICLPCLAVPLAALGGAAAVSALGGFVTGNLWLVAVDLLFGAALAGALRAAGRRSRTSAAVCCPPILPDRESPREELIEARQ